MESHSAVHPEMRYVMFLREVFDVGMSAALALIS
jgi:hypothetical protein